LISADEAMTTNPTNQIPVRVYSTFQRHVTSIELQSNQAALTSHLLG